MRKIKRIIALVTVAMFLLSLAAPAAMAATADEQTARLNGLNIVQGYPDGTFGLDKNITRAEFAVIAVKLLGIGDAIDGAKGATKFKDVPASYWGSGAINLAVGNGIIKGYPNGTFKPDANVTLAEATAMMVQVLGYGPSLQGTWPNNVMGKGSEIGLLKGVSVSDFNAPATRGAVFVAADNALDVKVMKQTAFGADPKWEVQGSTLLEDKLNYHKVKDAVIDSIPLTTTSLDSDEVNVTATGYTGKYKVVGSFDYNSMVGLNGTAWLNDKDDEIVLFQPDDTLVADTIKSVDAVANTFYLQTKDDSYGVIGAPALVADQTKYYVNYVGGKAFGDITAGMPVNVIIKNNKLTAVYGYNLTTEVVDRVDTANKKIYFKIGGGSEDLADNYAIVKDGKTISLDGVKAGMVISYALDGSGDLFYARVSDATVTGKFSNALTGTKYGANQTYKFNVGDKQYKTAIGAQYSTNDGKDYDTITDITKFTDIDGKDVTAYLDSFGKVAYVKSGEANVDSGNVVLVKEFTQATGADGNTYYIRVMKADGTEAYYTVNDDTTIDNNDAQDALTNTSAVAGAGYNFLALQTNATRVPASATDVTPGSLVKLELSSDGTTVDNIKHFANDEITPAGGATYDEDNKTVTTAGKTFQVQDDTKFYAVKNWDAAQNNAPAIQDAKFLSWGDVKGTWTATDIVTGKRNFGGAFVTVVYDGAKAKYVYINDKKTITSDKQVAIVVSKGISGSDKVLNVVLPSGAKTVKYGWTTEATKALVYFTLDTDNKADNYGVATPSARYNVKSIDSGADGSKLITLQPYTDATKTVDTNSADEVTIIVNADTTYFNADNDPVKADGIAVGNHITYYDVLNKDGNFDLAGNGIIDFVIIQDKL